MKILPFKIPKAHNEALIYQEDKGNMFYNKLHQHIDIQISMVLKGEGTLIIGDTLSDYKPNDIIVIGSNIPHVFNSDVEENEESYMLSLFFANDSFGSGFFQLGDFDVLNDFFSKSEFGFKVSSNREKIKNLFLNFKEASKIERFILFMKILELANRSRTQTISSFINRKNYSDNEGKRMSDVFDYTMRSYSENISLQEIANIASMTPNAFCKYFKQRTNKTYIQFLTEIRIDHASRLLKKNPDISIAEVAQNSGFSNISNFNRKFKLLKKTSPLKFRAK